MGDRIGKRLQLAIGRFELCGALLHLAFQVLVQASNLSLGALALGHFDLQACSVALDGVVEHHVLVERGQHFRQRGDKALVLVAEIAFSGPVRKINPAESASRQGDRAAEEALDRRMTGRERPDLPLGRAGALSEDLTLGEQRIG